MLDADLKIKQIVQEAHNVKTFKLDLESHAVNFEPGQFVSVTVPTPEGNQIRSFSISSSPTTKDHLEITVKRYEDSSAAKALHAMKKGQTLHVRGPFGQFILKPEDRNLSMIAGGNGVTPLMSMIRYLAATKNKLQPVLLYSNRTKEDILFYNELLEHEKNGTVNVFFTLTQNSPVGWSGFSSRVDLELIKKCFGSLSDKTFFLCGPPEMVRSLHETLLGLDVPEEHIRMEQFIRPKKA